jgi:hypothetical protein
MYRIKYTVEPVRGNLDLAQIYVRSPKTKRRANVGVLPYGPLLAAFQLAAANEFSDDTTLGYQARASRLRVVMRAVVLFNKAAFATEVK